MTMKDGYEHLASTSDPARGDAIRRSGGTTERWVYTEVPFSGERYVQLTLCMVDDRKDLPKDCFLVVPGKNLTIPVEYWDAYSRLVPGGLPALDASDSVPSFCGGDGGLIPSQRYTWKVRIVNVCGRLMTNEPPRDLHVLEWSRVPTVGEELLKELGKVDCRAYAYFVPHKSPWRS